jgi:hypothetical protein
LEFVKGLALAFGIGAGYSLIERRTPKVKKVGNLLVMPKRK